MKYACLIDVSTTTNSGPKGHDCPLQFACEFMTIDSVSSTENKRFDIALVPDEPVFPAGKMQVKYDEEFKAKSIDLETGLTKIYGILKKATDAHMYIIGYNLGYDELQLNSAFKRVLGLDPIDFNYDREHAIDIMLLAQKIIDFDKIGKFSMSEVYAYLFPDNPENYFLKRHELFEHENKTGSLFDNEISKAILQKIIDIQDFKSWEEIIDLFKSNKILKYMPFGKYSGDLIDDVFANDRQYLAWWLAANKNSGKMPDFKYTLETRYFNDIDLSADNS